MKFLCEHCKAKYQIADDKVAGRTVRMKCRKCGNPIEVRAAVTETSTNSRAPQDPTVRDTAANIAARAQQASAAPANKSGGLATSLSSTARPTRPPQASGRPSQAGGEGGLAGAFQRTAQREDDHSAGLDLRELSAADEWYVAINGVPVGPVRVAELRRKAALAVVTEDSLCWQEGMEEWRPIRAVTELAAVVREAASGGRAPLMSPPQSEGRVSAAPPRPAPRASAAPPAPAPRTAAGPSMAPKPVGPGQAPMQAVARSNVVSITSASRLATAEKLEPDAARSPYIAADPFASPPPAQALPAQGGYAPSPFVPPPAAAAALPPIVRPEPARKAPPWIVLAMIVLAGAFGVTAAILVFRQQPPAPQVVVVPQVPAPPVAAAPAPALGDLPPVAPADSSLAAAPSASAAKPTVASSHGSGTAVASNSHPSSASSAVAATDPALRDLIRQTTDGPAQGPSPTSAVGSSGGSSLTEGQITSVVMQHQTGVKRTCWERSSGTTASANVQVQITVAPSGAVQSAQATGNDPVVAHCIESEVRGWHFPGGSSLPIVIPFHFVRQ